MGSHIDRKGAKDRTLCELLSRHGKVQLKKLRPLVEDPKFICADCGRAAAKAKNLCSPKKL